MALSMKIKLSVFQRDKWICYYCGRPVVFHPSMRLFQEFVKKSGFDCGYYHRNWTNAYSPLLDHLGAVIDHIRPIAKGGKDTKGNLRTSCNKCNASKNSRNENKLPPLRQVKGKYGPPSKWDGLSAIFMVLAKQIELTAQEKRWLVAIRESPL
jgi:5-methylcytosine-specific restriction endonuclease McrA